MIISLFGRAIFPWPILSSLSGGPRPGWVQTVPRRLALPAKVHSSRFPTCVVHAGSGAATLIKMSQRNDRQRDGSRCEWVQEQTQIIASAIGKPAAKAPAIVKVNAESRFASGRTLSIDISLAPRRG
jgi:hypothetical protein